MSKQTPKQSQVMREACLTSPKKNCFNCKWLEWVEAEQWDPNGFYCHKRKYASERQHENHLAQLESDAYLKKSKVCCDLKEAA